MIIIITYKKVIIEQTINLITHNKTGKMKMSYSTKKSQKTYVI